MSVWLLKSGRRSLLSQSSHSCSHGSSSEALAVPTAVSDLTISRSLSSLSSSHGSLCSQSQSNLHLHAHPHPQQQLSQYLSRCSLSSQTRPSSPKKPVHHRQTAAVSVFAPVSEPFPFESFIQMSWEDSNSDHIPKLIQRLHQAIQYAQHRPKAVKKLAGVQIWNICSSLWHFHQNQHSREFLQALTQYLAIYSEDVPIRRNLVCKIICTFRNIADDNSTKRSLLEVVTKLVESNINQTIDRSMTANDLKSILYGIQKISHDTAEGQAFLFAIAKFIERETTIVLDITTISRCFHTISVDWRGSMNEPAHRAVVDAIDGVIDRSLSVILDRLDSVAVSASSISPESFTSPPSLQQQQPQQQQQSQKKQPQQWKKDNLSIVDFQLTELSAVFLIISTCRLSLRGLLSEFEDPHSQLIVRILREPRFYPTTSHKIRLNETSFATAMKNAENLWMQFHSKPSFRSKSAHRQYYRAMALTADVLLNRVEIPTTLTSSNLASCVQFVSQLSGEVLPELVFIDMVTTCVESSSAISVGDVPALASAITSAETSIGDLKRRRRLVSALKAAITRKVVSSGASSAAASTTTSAAVSTDQIMKLVRSLDKESDSLVSIVQAVTFAMKQMILCHQPSSKAQVEMDSASISIRDSNDAPAKAANVVNAQRSLKNAEVLHIFYSLFAVRRCDAAGLVYAQTVARFLSAYGGDVQLTRGELSNVLSAVRYISDRTVEEQQILAVVTRYVEGNIGVKALATGFHCSLSQSFTNIIQFHDESQKLFYAIAKLFDDENSTLLSFEDLLLLSFDLNIVNVADRANPAFRAVLSSLTGLFQRSLARADESPEAAKVLGELSHKNVKCIINVIHRVSRVRVMSEEDMQHVFLLMSVLLKKQYYPTDEPIVISNAEFEQILKDLNHLSSSPEGSWQHQCYGYICTVLSSYVTIESESA